jgi:hypothetical protein
VQPVDITCAPHLLGRKEGEYIIDPRRAMGLTRLETEYDDGVHGLLEWLRRGLEAERTVSYDLFACQPIAEAALLSGGDFLFTAKPESHKAIYDFMNGATLDEVSITRKEGSKKLTHRYRWFSAAPLREGKDALMVDWIGLAISDAKGKVTYDGAFLTSLQVTREKRRRNRRLR